MNSFVFYSPTKFVFGQGSYHEAGHLCAQHGARRVLLVYGGGSVVRSGLLEGVRQSLEQKGIPCVPFGGVQPNPKLSHIRQGIDLARLEETDFILAVGGGSVIDAAKAIGFGVLYQGDIWDFFLRTRNPDRTLPVGVVLTIAASGSEGSPNCVVTNDELGIKSGCASDCLRPVFAVMDPELTYSLSPFQTACGITDIMMHTHERYFTPVPDNQLTDELCEGLLRTVIHLGPQVLERPRDYNLRAQIMWAGMISHNNTVGVGRIQDSACHRIQGRIGAKYDSAHGAGLAAVCPAWMQYVYRNNLPRFIRYAVKVWQVDYDPYNPEGTALEGILRLKDFFRSIGMPVTRAELGVEDQDLDWLCQMEAGNMHKLGPEDVRGIYDLMV